MAHSPRNGSTSTPRAVPGQDEEVGEQTPLVSRSMNPISFTNPFGRTGRGSIRNSLPSISYFRGESPKGSDIDAVDIDELQLSLSRVSSVSWAINLGYGSPQHRCTSVDAIRPRPQWPVPAEEPAGKMSRQPSFVTETEVGSCDALPVGEEFESKFIGISPLRFWLLFVVIMLGYFIACFDSTLMASSHPVITSYFHASQAASWLSTVFLVTSTAFQPLFGRLSDTIGRKPVFLLSFFLFGITTLWCALAESIESFIAARAVCGLGAGGTMSMSLIIVSDLVRIEARGVFQSHINIAFGLGSAAGAAFGGFLCDSLGWRWAFGVQVPFLGLCFILGLLFTPSNLGPMLMYKKAECGEEGPMFALKSFDFKGSFLLLVSVSSLILALNLGGNIFAWTSPVVLSSFGLFAVSVGVFCWIEQKARQPVMPLQYLTKPPVANMVAANFLGGIATNTILFNVPLFFQAVLLKSASDSGFRLAVPSLAGAIAGVATGYIITYTRRLKPTLVLGAVIYLIGSIAILFMSKDVTEFFSLVLITGVPVGQGFVFPNTMMSALAVSPQADQAVVTTTVGLWRNLGVVMGVALSSLVFQNCLVRNLDKLVLGPEKSEVVSAVRSSVNVIRELSQPYQDQVIAAYALSLRTTFTCAVVASVMLLICVLPIHLPILKRGRKIHVTVGE